MSERAIALTSRDLDSITPAESVRVAKQPWRGLGVFYRRYDLPWPMVSPDNETPDYLRRYFRDLVYSIDLCLDQDTRALGTANGIPFPLHDIIFRSEGFYPTPSRSYALDLRSAFAMAAERISQERLDTFVTVPPMRFAETSWALSGSRCSAAFGVIYDITDDLVSVSVRIRAGSARRWREGNITTRTAPQRPAAPLATGPRAIILTDLP